MDILPNPYYTHYYYLVGAMSILLGNNITEDKLNMVDNLLNSFCRRFADLYGKLWSTCTVMQAGDYITALLIV